MPLAAEAAAQPVAVQAAAGVAAVVDAAADRCSSDQRRILCAASDCLATAVDPFGRAKLLLSRIPVSPLDRPARREPRPPEEDFAITEH